MKEFLSKWKLHIGMVLVMLSFIIGLVSKIPFFELIQKSSDFKSKPLYYISAIFTYIFSWLLGIIGVFLIGKRTYESLQNSLKIKVRDEYRKRVVKPLKPVKRISKKVKKRLLR